MKSFSRFRTVLAAVVIVAGTAAIAVADHGGNNSNNNNNNDNNQVRLRTRLAGAPNAGEGNADFRSDANKMRTRLNVEVEHVNLPAGTSLDVSVQHGTSSTTVGQIKLSATGEGELELNSQDGATVPAIQPGDMVIVSNAGTPILSGTF